MINGFAKNCQVLIVAEPQLEWKKKQTNKQKQQQQEQSFRFDKYSVQRKLRNELRRLCCHYYY